MTQKNSALIDSRFDRYCKLGLGATLLTGAVTTMDASVVYTNFNNQLFADTNTADTASTNYSFDFNGDGLSDLRLFTRNQGSTSTSNFAVVVAGLTGSTLSPINIVGFGGGAYYYPSRLATGAVIGPAQQFVTLSLTSSGSFLQAGTFAFGNGFTNSRWKTAGQNSGFLGVSFMLNDGLHYGFIGLTVQAQGNGALSRAYSIGGIAYETTPNTPITAFGSTGVSVPEPTSLGLVALGGLGLLAYRRRRAQKAAANA